MLSSGKGEEDDGDDEDDEADGEDRGAGEQCVLRRCGN